MAALLLFLFALAGAPSGGALPPPSNVRHSLDIRRCQLHVTWSPPEARINDTCSLTYNSVVRTDGNEGDTVFEDPNPSRIVKVDLGKEIVFRVRAELQCLTSPNMHVGAWFNITLQQKGIPGTGAVDLHCVWHNEKYIVCSWKPGENATQHSYDLFYWYDDSGVQQCTNFSREGNNFQCTFSYEMLQGTSILTILVEGRSEDVRPVCINNEKLLRKMHPPTIVNVSKDSNGVHLEWTKPVDRNNLHYEVEIKDTQTNSVWNVNVDQLQKIDCSLFLKSCDDRIIKSIGLEPNRRHTFRVRVIPNDNGIWSDWSEEAVWDDREDNFYILLYIFVPFGVAVLTIIVLVYLKRIKLLILPKIPDPGQVLKKMLEDQSEDLQKQPTYDPVKDEQIQALTLTEPTGNEV